MSSELAASLPQASGMAFLQPLAVLRRRAGVIGAVLALALVAVTLISVLWPPTYVSTGTILIEQQEIPTDLVRSTISSYAAQRIQIITQRVLTTSKLLEIIEKHDLFPEERRSKGRETIIQMMRDNIFFRTISADVIDPRQGAPVKAIIAFSLGFQNRSPEIAATVANELSTLYLQENLSMRRIEVEETTAFLLSEANKLEKQLAEVESQLAKFKERNYGNLPEVTQINLQLLSRIDEQRREIDQQLRSLDQQQAYLETQLAQTSTSSKIFTSTGEQILSPADQLKRLRSQYENAVAVYAPDHPDVVRLKRMIEGLEATTTATVDENERLRQLERAEADLAVARQAHSDEHPDVVRLARLVGNLRSAPAPAAPPKPVVSPDAADNPAYIQQRNQLDLLALQRKSLEDRRTALDTRVGELEGRLEASPGVEQQYAELRRDLDNTQAKYREVRQKQMEAQLAENLENERKGERLSLIEPPLVPQEPTSPNRSMIVAIGAFMALIVAAGVALALEFLDGTVRGGAHLASLVTAPPLVVIPRFAAPDASRRRMRRWVAVGAGALITFVLALILVNAFYRPLDVLWAVLMRKLGAG